MAAVQRWPQLFKMVAGGRTQIAAAGGVIQHLKPPEQTIPDIRRNVPVGNIIPEKCLKPPIPE